MFHSPGSDQALSDLFDFSGFPPEGFELPGNFVHPGECEAFFLNQAAADQIPDGFRAIGVPHAGNKLIESPKKVVINRYAEAGVLVISFSILVAHFKK